MVHLPIFYSIATPVNCQSLPQCQWSSPEGYGNIHYLSPLRDCWPSDAIWRQGYWSTLAQVMASCLTAPIHYLNQCWLIISKVLWHSSEGIIMRCSEDANQQNKIENYIFRIIFRSPRGQWVNISITKQSTINRNSCEHVLIKLTELQNTPGKTIQYFLIVMAWRHTSNKPFIQIMITMSYGTLWRHQAVS